jgi:hypothetical protein
LLPSISLLADEDVVHREEDFLALAERADAALAEMRAMEAPADPQEVVKFMASLAERRGFNLPSPTALAMDARAVAARIPADLLPLALERIWGDFAYRRLPEPPDFAKAVEAELRDRREAAAKVHTVALKARHARWLEEKRRDADTRHATEKERERARWEAMRPAEEEDPRPSSLPRSEGLPVVDPELRRGDPPKAEVAEVASEVEADPGRPGDLPDTASQPEQGYEIHTDGTSGNDHGCVDDPPAVAFRDGALGAVGDIGADLDCNIAGPVEDDDHPARAGGKRLNRAKAVRGEAGDPPDGAAPTPVSGDARAVGRTPTAFRACEEETGGQTRAEITHDPPGLEIVASRLKLALRMELTQPPHFMLGSVNCTISIFKRGPSGPLSFLEGSVHLPVIGRSLACPQAFHVSSEYDWSN